MMQTQFSIPIQELNNQFLAFLHSNYKGFMVDIKLRGEIFENKPIIYEYAPTFISANNRNYTLRYPLRCLFEKEDGIFTIKSEMLGIVGTGATDEIAKTAFSDEFDYIYQRYNSLDDNSLAKKLQIVKTILNQLVLN